jgi:polyhydroxybutyrate depolymerase
MSLAANLIVVAHRRSKAFPSAEGSTTVEFVAVTTLLTLRTVAGALATIMACAAFAEVHATPPEVPRPFLAGTHKVMVDRRVSGVRRSYYVHVPPEHFGTAPLPVVIALHGAFSTARKFERESGLSLLADREGFIVVYPQGIGLGDLFRHWNSGHCCGKARKMSLDDVGFALSTVDDVGGHNPIDRTRLYVAGFSNGGMLAYRIAAEHPDVVAAVAVVSATIGGTPSAKEPEWSVPRPERPVAVLAIHGRADTSVPYEGGRGPQSRGSSSAISLARSIRFWVDADGCDTEPQVEAMDRDRIQRQVWSGCREDAEVVLYSLDRWGHEWPKASSLDGFDAASTIWRFFAQHRRGSGSTRSN